MITTLTQTENVILIDGAAGKLEIALSESPEVGEANKVWGIVCHPHPLHGGTMYNKVVTTLVKAFQGKGVNTIRFNFRGVGRSEGTYSEGIGELEDLKTVINWVREKHPDIEIWLGGFSFGACIAAVGATQIENVTKLVTIAPPVSIPSMQTLPPVHAEWVLVQGEEDEIVPALDVIEWAKTRDPKPTILRFPEATHFFHGQLGELRMRIEDAL